MSDIILRPGAANPNDIILRSFFILSSYAVARLLDTSSHGGVITTAGQTFFTDANGQLLAVNGALHTCPISGHGITPITATTTLFFIEGVAVVRVGDVAGCGAIIVVGSPDFTSQ